MWWCSTAYISRRLQETPTAARRKQNAPCGCRFSGGVCFSRSVALVVWSHGVCVFFLWTVLCTENVRLTGSHNTTSLLCLFHANLLCISVWQMEMKNHVVFSSLHGMSHLCYILSKVSFCEVFDLWDTIQHRPYWGSMWKFGLFTVFWMVSWVSPRANYFEESLMC